MTQARTPSSDTDPIPRLTLAQQQSPGCQAEEQGRGAGWQRSPAPGTGAHPALGAPFTHCGEGAYWRGLPHGGPERRSIGAPGRRASTCPGFKGLGLGRHQGPGRSSLLAPRGLLQGSRGAGGPCGTGAG
ncbi:hypothetical protein NDU88_007373 [Pleurodeles waltl]|uniref:Uncharacterized protein n=1 Tax=Pleurodeles waltl TaxID=8319 RepID=A0AAV7M2Q8_PLEWA|nr:hypothetical protein NDU88_007373 [Pleurodeles waltl]